jgi:radical SAM protein with 4Fe4S-binding SPASM domain
MDKLNNLIWYCTRAYERPFAYSLGGGKPLPNELATAEAKSLMDKAADFGVEIFFVTSGGDPFIRGDMMELLKYASECGLLTYLKTDGWKIDVEMASRLASYGTRLIISIAGLKDVDDMLRGEGAYERSLAAAKVCAEQGMGFILSVVNTKYVVNQVEALVNLSEELGAESFNLSSLIPQPICVKDQLAKLGPLEPAPAEHERELVQIYQLSRERAGRIGVGAYDIFYNRILACREPDVKRRSPCSVCNNLENNEWLEVLDDGKMYGCSPLGLMVGDIRVDSIPRVMEKLRNLELVKRLADRDNLKGKCGRCEYKLICGGCRAKALVYSGDMFAQDPLCPYQPRLPEELSKG